MTSRRRVVSFEVAADGAVELPEGAELVSLEFDSEGSYGFERRPSILWAVVPANG